MGEAPDQVGCRMSEYGWPRRGFLNLVGLDHKRSNNGKILRAELAEAGVDPRTGGAVAVTTEAVLDGKDAVRSIKTYYWRMLPNGDQLYEKLFDIELEPVASTTMNPTGGAQAVAWMEPRAVWVLGRKVYDKADGGDIDHGHGTSQGLMRNLTRVMGAVGRVNRDLRNGKLPNVAQVLEEYAVHDAVGERLVITGQAAKGGFDFDATRGSVANMHKGALVVPAMIARALTGYDVNNLDEDKKLRSEPRQATNGRNGSVYTTEVELKGGKHPAVSTAINPTSVFGDMAARGIPRLTNIAWKGDEQHRASLRELDLLGEDITDDDHLTCMRALGVTNRILHDLRAREYPATMDHLVEYDLNHLVDEFEPPPPLKEGGRLTMLSVGGNNMEEIADGFGGVIGGNSKVVCHEGLDAHGKVGRVGVIIDLGLHLSPKDESDVSAAPDVVEHLKYCDHILITHRHLDHTDGLFAYMQYGYLKGKTVHATPEVIRAIRDKISTYPSIHRDDLPTFVALQGEGWLHVKDKQGNIRLSVDYARNATPHSARTTPFTVHGHYKGQWLGSYMNHGDARFGWHNAEDYTGAAVGGDHLNKDFFVNSNTRLLKELPRLDSKIAERGPTYFDMDTTSILKKGWCPTEAQVEDNLTELSDLFSDKGMLLSMISTNDNRFETALRVGTRTGRDITEFGANLEKSVTTFNVLGVNDLRHTPGPRNNVQLYLDDFFEKQLLQAIEALKSQRADASPHKLKKIDKKIERKEVRLEHFKELAAMPHKFGRYEKRDALEDELEKRFGKQVGLGSIRVGRNSKTSRAIMNWPGRDGRRLVLLTGTQGTNVEVDAALTALSEGRSLMDGNPDNSHTARPVDPQNNVVVISQTAIPGNDGKQNELVRKLAARGFTVVQAVHDGFKIFNLDSARQDVVVAKLKKLKKEVDFDADGTLVVKGMPIHASGHGYEQDCRAWARLVRADVTAPQHTSDPESSRRMAEICAEGGLRQLDRVVPNFERIAMKAGDSPANTQIESVGRSLPSLIRIRSIRQQRKYYGGHLEAQRLVSHDGEGSFRSDGLLANARESGMYEKAFARRDVEAAARYASSREAKRPEPVPENRMAPPPERPDRGAQTPGSEQRNRLFRGISTQTVGFTGVGR